LPQDHAPRPVPRRGPRPRPLGKDCRRLYVTISPVIPSCGEGLWGRLKPQLAGDGLMFSWH
jgi:hypothetical protein